MNRVDGKGKVFTERVRKTGVEVRMQTLQGQVHGFMHVVPGQRVKDLLNNGDELFLAVTDATLYGYGDDGVQQVDFIALNKQQIVSVILIDEDKPRDQQDEGYYISWE
ncbi:MAG: hypothetical protein ABI670_23120 [Chloroflexota bacterium]